jgi:hypothetical protein
MRQQGQVFELQTMRTDGWRPWAYRYRAGGRGSRRVQRGGFESEQAAPCRCRRLRYWARAVAGNWPETGASMRSGCSTCSPAQGPTSTRWTLGGR